MTITEKVAYLKGLIDVYKRQHIFCLWAITALRIRGAKTA